MQPMTKTREAALLIKANQYADLYKVCIESEDEGSAGFMLRKYEEVVALLGYDPLM